MAFELPPLPYAVDALQPAIGKRTMEVHHGLHHGAYVKGLNAALEGHPDLQKKSVEDLLRGLETVPESIRTAVRNHGGGHANHSMFWTIMGPKGGGSPTGDLGDALTSAFGDFESFKTRFNDAGGKRFGSGWVWVVATPEGHLEITSTANQDSPLSAGQEVLLGNDVWEHAYYLTYENRRPEYLKAWWNVVDWAAVGARFKAIRARARK